MDVWVGQVTSKKMLNDANEGQGVNWTGCASLFCPMVRFDYLVTGDGQRRGKHGSRFKGDG